MEWEAAKAIWTSDKGSKAAQKALEALGKTTGALKQSFLFASGLTISFMQTQDRFAKPSRCSIVASWKTTLWGPQLYSHP